MPNNYASWSVSIQDFWNITDEREKLCFLVRFAILAPSTHNSQPWKFHIDNNTITIEPDLSRALRVSDPHNRHLLISLGCALENILIAADYYGYKTTVDGLKVTFSKSNPSSDKNHLIFSIPQRRSNRNAYKTRMPDGAFQQVLSKLNSDNVHLSLVSDSEKKSAIIDILSKSRFLAFSNPAFRNELADYKRTNLTHSPTGMPGFTMGFSTLASFFTSAVIRLVNIMKFIGKNEDRLFDATPLFCIVSSKDNDQSAWVSIGRAVQRILLEAQRHGIASAVSAVPPVPQALQNILGIQTRPQLFIRLGYTDIIPRHSPRLSTKNVMI